MASTKCVLRHPDSASARETRDTVFCQMRRAIDLIHFVIREGISADQGADDVDLIDMPGVSYQVIQYTFFTLQQQFLCQILIKFETQ